MFPIFFFLFCLSGIWWVVVIWIGCGAGSVLWIVLCVGPVDSVSVGSALVWVYLQSGLGICLWLNVALIVEVASKLWLRRPKTRSRVTVEAVCL